MKYIIELCITFVGCGVVALKKKKLNCLFWKQNIFSIRKPEKW